AASTTAPRAAPPTAASAFTGSKSNGGTIERKHRVAGSHRAETGNLPLDFGGQRGHPYLPAAGERDVFLVAREREVGHVSETGLALRPWRGSCRGNRVEHAIFTEQDLARRHPREGGDVGGENVSIYGIIRQRDGRLSGRRDKQVLFSPRIPEE